MRFSIRLNNDLPVADYIELAQLAEGQGFDQIWVSNDIFLRSNLAILPAMAIATDHIEVGTGILNPYTINPAEIAMYASTMDELTGNRFNLGLAAGAGDFLEWVGIPQTKPLSMIRDTVQVIRQLQSGDRTSVNSSLFPWTDKAYMRFDSPRLTPIYIGAMGPRMLTLTGEISDGALPLLFPPENYFAIKPYLQAGVNKRAQTLPELDTAVCIWVSLSTDRVAARWALAQKVAYYGHTMSPMILDRLGLTRDDFADIERAIMVERNEALAISLVDDRMLRIGVVGEPADVIERLEPIVADGAQHLSFGPPLGPDIGEGIRLLGEVVRYFED